MTYRIGIIAALAGELKALVSDWSRQARRYNAFKSGLGLPIPSGVPGFEDAVGPATWPP